MHSSGDARVVLFRCKGEDDFPLREEGASVFELQFLGNEDLAEGHHIIVGLDRTVDFTEVRENSQQFLQDACREEILCHGSLRMGID
jgi:hypothetical protein